MSATFQLPDGQVLEMWSDPIEVTSNSPRPDPKWSFTDEHGHTHTWESGTWHRVQDDPDEPPFWFDVDGEEHNAPSHTECKLCGEHVHPGTRGPSAFREFIPGPLHCTLNGQPISREEAVALVEAAR